jgi:glycosyltransferase involved in cell wall biosynthesis
MGVDVFDARYTDRGRKRRFNQIRANTYGSVNDLKAILKKFKPDVIHTHNLNQRSGYAWMTDTKIPIASSLHNFRIFCPASIAWRNGNHCFKCRDHSAFNAVLHNCAGKVGLLNSLRLEIFNRNDPQLNIPKIFFTGSQMMNLALSPIINVDKLKILRNPTLATNTKSTQRTDLGPSGWLIASRFTHEKGILEVISSWPSSEKLDIAGNGPLLNQISDSIKDKPNIRLIGTFPPGSKDIYRNYEGLIFPSTWIEGSPLVVIDAISCGTPVICTDLSSASEQINISGCGVVVKGRLSKLKIISAQSEIRKNFSTMSNSGINKSTSEFSVTNWSNKLLTFLSEIV